MVSVVSSSPTGPTGGNFIFTTHKQSLGQGNIFAPVCHSVHRGEYLGRYTPQDQVHPQTRYTPGPGTPFPPRPGTPTWTREIQATSRWYTSYWNAFLFLIQLDAYFVQKCQKRQICVIYENLDSLSQFTGLVGFQQPSLTCNGLWGHLLTGSETRESWAATQV